jgi:hypothetical protein
LILSCLCQQGGDNAIDVQRISSIRSRQEAELEMRREQLRDSRWARRRSQLITVGIAGSTIALLSTGAPNEILHVLRAFVGFQL